MGPAITDTDPAITISTVITFTQTVRFMTMDFMGMDYTGMDSMGTEILDSIPVAITGTAIEAMAVVDLVAVDLAAAFTVERDSTGVEAAFTAVATVEGIR
jgi:hypothetical protein